MAAADGGADGETSRLDEAGAGEEPVVDEGPEHQEDDEAPQPIDLPMDNDVAAEDEADGKESRTTDPAMAAEFTLLVVLQPDNVRHRVTVTPSMTVGALTEALCSDLRLDAELVSFPDLNPPAGQTYTDIPLVAFGLDGSSSEEQVLHAYVARRLDHSDYVMPDQIQVQVFDGNCKARLDHEFVDTHWGGGGGQRRPRATTRLWLASRSLTDESRTLVAIATGKLSKSSTTLRVRYALPSRRVDQSAS